MELNHQRRRARQDPFRTDPVSISSCITSRTDPRIKSIPALPASRNARTPSFQSRYTRCNECRVTETNVYVRFWQADRRWISYSRT
jgi:hypothetical protein